MHNHRTQLASLALASTATAVALGTHAPHLAAPLTTWTGEQIALATAWAVALVAATWVGLTSLVALLALVSRNRIATNLTRVCAPRLVRHVVEASLVASLLVVPARAAVAAPAVQAPLAAPNDQPVVRAPTPAPTPKPKPAPTPSPAPSSAHTHVVVAGDNLWRIARAELVARGHTEPDIETTARYWRTVVERNRNALRSHNPNLIYPGESIALPDPG